MSNPRCGYCVPPDDCDYYRATQRADAGYPLEELYCVCSAEAKTLACLLCEAGGSLVHDKVNLDDRAAVVAAIGEFAIGEDEGCDLAASFIDRAVAAARAKQRWRDDHGSGSEEQQ